MPKRSLRKFLPTPARLRDVKGWVCFEICSIDTNFAQLNLYRTCYGDWPFLLDGAASRSMIVAVFVAIRVGANVPLAFSLIFITNPLTMPVIYLAAYLLGSALLNAPVIDASAVDWLDPTSPELSVSGPPSSWAVLLWVSSLPFSAISLPTVYGDCVLRSEFRREHAGVVREKRWKKAREK